MVTNSRVFKGLWFFCDKTDLTLPTPRLCNILGTPPLLLVNWQSILYSHPFILLLITVSPLSPPWFALKTCSPLQRYSSASPLVINKDWSLGVTSQSQQWHHADKSSTTQKHIAIFCKVNMTGQMYAPQTTDRNTPTTIVSFDSFCMSSSFQLTLELNSVQWFSLMQWNITVQGKFWRKIKE